MADDSKTLLIIGAGGFIGGFIAAEGLRRGYTVWAGVRASTSRRFLTDPRLKFVVFDYDDPDQVEQAIREAAPAAHGWDDIIWNLGATKSVTFAGFNLVNFMYPRTFVETLRRLDMVPRRFLYISSLSALGPGDEKTYAPLTSATVPNPNTRYGLSKIKTETYLETLADFPWIIFRPTGVYGPHEQDYLMMIKSIDSHFDFGVGYRRQMLTFIYVDDLVNAMFDALASPDTLRRKYIISEDRAYSQAEFRKMVARELGCKLVIPVRLPLWTAWIASVVSEKWGSAKGKPMTLNRDKFKIMRQRNWNCDISDARRDFGFTPRVDLAEGIRRTVAAYRESKGGER
ncbi:MAG: NAD(P)-dependent oxidoreductase [Muribaculaceae bacterium]|nr:NAD(P)-dependent oxidoreductase [Muribaculaceae bacterium]